MVLCRLRSRTVTALGLTLSVTAMIMPSASAAAGPRSPTVPTSDGSLDDAATLSPNGTSPPDIPSSTPDGDPVADAIVEGEPNAVGPPTTSTTSQDRSNDKLTPPSPRKEGRGRSGDRTTIVDDGPVAKGDQPGAGVQNVVPRFTIEAKAWIPQPAAVDPEHPGALPFLASALIHEPCFTPSFFLRPLTLVNTFFLGDGHDGYVGSSRVKTMLEFDWNEGEIQNVAVPPGEYGTTELIGQYILPFRTETCTLKEEMATTATFASAGGSSFSLSYSSANPVPRLPTPAIDADITGNIAPDGTLTFHYQTDRFPSHGVAVSRDGVLQLTDTVHDVSCTPDFLLLGVTGVVIIGTGLNDQSNEGDRTVQWNDAGRVEGAC